MQMAKHCRWFTLIFTYQQFSIAMPKDIKLGSMEHGARLKRSDLMNDGILKKNWKAVKSKHVNATGTNLRAVSAMEYRKVVSGNTFPSLSKSKASTSNRCHQCILLTWSMFPLQGCVHDLTHWLTRLSAKYLRVLHVCTLFAFSAHVHVDIYWGITAYHSALQAENLSSLDMS